MYDPEINPEKFLPQPASIGTVGIYCRYIMKGLLKAIEKEKKTVSVNRR